MKQRLIAAMSDLKKSFVDEAAGARKVWNRAYTSYQLDYLSMSRENELKLHTNALLDQCRKSKAVIARLHEFSPVVFREKAQTLTDALNKRINAKMGDPGYCNLLIGDIEKIRYFADQNDYSGIQDIVSSYRENPAAMAKIKRECASVLDGSGVVFEKADEEIGAEFLKGAFDSANDLFERIERFAFLLQSNKPDQIQRAGTLPGQGSPEYDNIVSELGSFIDNLEKFTD